MNIGYDIYGSDCAGGISIHITNASNSKDKIGKNVFVKPALEQFRLPEGLIASSKNKLKFYGHFGYKKCIHLMGDNTPAEELFFIYDSVDVSCPYKYWNSEKMEFDSITCGKHGSFHERIRVIKE
jgi:hypothetical protein